MGSIAEELRNCTNEKLVSMSDMGTYKRSCKEAEKSDRESFPEVREGAEEISVTAGKETVCLRVPLEKSSCSCVSRKICRHIVMSIIVLRDSLPVQAEKAVAEEVPQKPTEKEPEKTPEKKKPDFDRVAINGCAVDCIGEISGVIKRGLVRCPENTPDIFTTCAVRCHSLRMADAERLLRETGGRLSDFTAGRASFDYPTFIKKFCECNVLLSELSKPDFSEDSLGNFKQKYEPYDGKLTLIPLGARTVLTGDYSGEVYYFLNADLSSDRKFLSLSDLRPNFYESSAARYHHNSSVTPWGMDTPIQSLMHSKITLKNAKLSGGKLSTSKETSVIAIRPLDLDCDEVYRNIVYDFRQIVVELSEMSENSDELSRMYLIAPDKCVRSDFDKNAQVYRMRLADHFGNFADVSVKYRAETKKFIELLEKISENLIDDGGNFVILAVAHIGEKSLELFPVEIYDFLSPCNYRPFELPPQYSSVQSSHIELISSLISDIRQYIEAIFRCGLQSGIKADRSLLDRSQNYGMSYLHSFLSDLMQFADNYRHGDDSACKKTLLTVNSLVSYSDCISSYLSAVNILSEK